MKIVALFRVSTEKQASEGSSLESQERRYHELAASNGWETAAAFKGTESASQASGDRLVVLQQVLSFIRANPTDAIYVHEQSRLTRGDQLEVAMLMRELKERGIKIIVNGLVRDLASIDERFMVGIQSLVDHTESERIKERMQRGKRQRASQGKKVSGPAPYGYMNPPAHMPTHGTLEIVEDQAAVVRRIFDLAVKGRGDHAIAGELNASHIPAPLGGLWGKSTIRRVLTNVAYIGTAATNVWVTNGSKRSFRLNVANPKAIVHPNAHPAIIEQAVWDAYHNRARTPRTHVPRMLTGLLYVAGMPYGSDSLDAGPVYRPPRGVRGHAWIESASLDQQVWDAFASLATSPEVVAAMMEQASNPGQCERVEADIKRLEAQVAKHNEKLERLLDMRAEGEIDKVTFAKKSGECRAAVEANTRELDGLRSKALSFDGTQAHRVVKVVQTVLAGRTRLTSDQKRTALRSVVRRIDADVAATGGSFARDARGRVVPGRTPRWAVTRLSFRLACGSIHEPRAGQLGTTFCNPAQASGTEKDGRGQLGTTFSCSAPPAPARP